MTQHPEEPQKQCTSCHPATLPERTQGSGISLQRTPPTPARPKQLRCASAGQLSQRRSPGSQGLLHTPHTSSTAPACAPRNSPRQPPAPPPPLTPAPPPALPCRAVRAEAANPCRQVGMQSKRQAGPGSCPDAIPSTDYAIPHAAAFRGCAAVPGYSSVTGNYSVSPSVREWFNAFARLGSLSSFLGSRLSNVFPPCQQPRRAPAALRISQRRRASRGAQDCKHRRTADSSSQAMCRLRRPYALDFHGVPTCQRNPCCWRP